MAWGSTSVANTPHVLFLCSGNYYRSRLAEAVFNFEAERAGLPWRAISRALKYDPLRRHPDKLSPHTRRTLEQLRIPLSYVDPLPRSVTRSDLTSAACTIAMSEREHRPILEANHQPLGELRLEYWDFDDIHLQSPAVVMPKLVERTRALVREIAAGQLPAGCRPPSRRRD